MTKPFPESSPATPTKRILIAGSSHGVYGGIEVFMVALAEYLDAQDGLEAEVLFKLTGDFARQESMSRLIEASRVRCHVLRSGEKSIGTLVKDFDLLHIQNLPPDLIFAASRHGLPVVATIHNWRRPLRSAHTLLWRIGHKIVGARTYNSNFVRQSWTHRTESWNDRVIPTVSRLPESIDENEPRAGFCFIGRWIPGKGLRDLVEAYAESGLDSPECPLTLLGDGPIRGEIESRVHALKLSNVSMPGLVSDAEKFERLQHCRWLVAPSNCKEDLGLTPIEARALGVPAIVSRDGGLTEAGGPSALNFAPGDFLELAERLKEAEALSEDDYAQRSRIARESLASFLQPMSVYTDIYERLWK